MQLKSRHLILFVIACLVLKVAQTPGGALLALAALLQLALLIHGLEISRRSQSGALKLFLVSVPLFLFWGGVSSFMPIYIRENQHLFLAMASVILLGLSFLLCFQVVFTYFFFEKNDFKLIATLEDSLHSVKMRRSEFIKISLMIFIFSMVPWLSSDWKLVFALTVIHLFLNRDRLKTAVSGF